MKFKYNKYLITFFMVLLNLYFIQNLFDQEKGFFAKIKIKNNIKEQRQNLNEILVQKEELENKNKLMQTNSLDFDMLEEQARSMFSYVKDGEEIIYWSD